MTRTEQIARAMHTRFEDRAHQKHMGHRKTRWEDLQPEHQNEFMDYAVAINTALNNHD